MLLLPDEKDAPYLRYTFKIQSFIHICDTDTSVIYQIHQSIPYMATSKKTVAKKTTQKPAVKKTTPARDTGNRANHRAAKPKLTDLAYEQLEEAIITLRIPPGSVISELTLSEMLDIG